MNDRLSKDERDRIDAYWRAANYLSVVTGARHPDLISQSSADSSAKGPGARPARVSFKRRVGRPYAEERVTCFPLCIFWSQRPTSCGPFHKWPGCEGLSWRQMQSR
jgi:hypothetical protein